MASAIEIDAMRRALQLARRGPRGLNPQVGAILLSPGGEVLAEGYHRGAGTPHAEVDALSQVTADAARGATAVVTLEPCNHTGRTGPCAVALIEAGVARVVYALDDPTDAAAGGADRLRGAGVVVESGVEADAAEEVIHDWVALQRTGRPHVTVKWAQSLDGRAAADDGTSQWITGAVARRDVHARRAIADAIVAGTGTIHADDPALTARAEDGSLLPAQPIPVVIGSTETAPDAAVRRHPHEPLFYPTHDLPAVLADLAGRGVQRVFVEGGPTLASAFIRAGLADELLVYLAPVLLGGSRLALGDLGVPSIANARRLAVASVEILGDDMLLVARPAAAPATGPAAAAPATRSAAAAPATRADRPAVDGSTALAPASTGPEPARATAPQHRGDV
ncbi:MULTISPECIES: bifunctional diaminohydroxyphosphoribosylaminopyrimidine deaminase/5-amino-6-(5-phosphoribosylamino)uracil reductase RibD [Microbacterium]|uniref:bifunctional diaminohydroxyphosphoribosylaminopyrimidine deaminase/5-amino-6-(5-phosphoribosylamino)uracil reductase RibD n=1 Tax=Microbacterium TaxID=33882 RepID=UPI0027802FC4|nr:MULTISPECIES: bifunctional diaminohydroxyphosphoribosylaminopyrimidine deaminase/5-amino-6-(5-phosphoribosylamino)uracil reductase RibD [Microbacterium]MDQ1083194.1 diaminohydroxyphosphoribosylaminopyrimidine deaminase/5-amino-6-(5-phosphoribosylamino)uracil reductase [Microbacterium sp. SORGH_AS_0344]MDQ1171529.1 diaminohydroxyphosphoribosylaminopyrimidine deaminase/5-amino-6-(5-phosphoribosylamino)uracil reductase [Microbacterium proteolyticum]